MEVVKVAVIAILGVMLAIHFRGQKPEYSIYIGVAISLILFGYVFSVLEAVLMQLEEVRMLLGEGSKYLQILLKLVGITYICEFASGICKDSGYQAVSGQIEIFGKLTVLFLGLPILLAVIQSIQGFMG